jgi:hypothetical protein
LAKFSWNLIVYNRNKEWIHASFIAPLSITLANASDEVVEKRGNGR